MLLQMDACEDLELSVTIQDLHSEGLIQKPIQYSDYLPEITFLHCTSEQVCSPVSETDSGHGTESLGSLVGSDIVDRPFSRQTSEDSMTGTLEAAAPILAPFPARRGSRSDSNVSQESLVATSQASSPDSVSRLSTCRRSSIAESEEGNDRLREAAAARPRKTRRRRRLSSDDDLEEADGDVNVPGRRSLKCRRRSKGESTSSEESQVHDKRQRRKDQNREAAQRCRQKKRVLALTVVEDYKNYRSLNREVEHEIRTLAKQKRELERYLAEHVRDDSCKHRELQVTQQNRRLLADGHLNGELGNLNKNSHDVDITSTSSTAQLTKRPRTENRAAFKPRQQLVRNPARNRTTDSPRVHNSRSSLPPSPTPTGRSWHLPTPLIPTVVSLVAELYPDDSDSDSAQDDEATSDDRQSRNTTETRQTEIFKRPALPGNNINSNCSLSKRAGGSPANELSHETQHQTVSEPCDLSGHVTPLQLVTKFNSTVGGPVHGEQSSDNSNSNSPPLTHCFSSWYALPSATVSQPPSYATATAATTSYAQTHCGISQGHCVQQTEVEESNFFQPGFYRSNSNNDSSNSGSIDSRHSHDLNMASALTMSMNLHHGNHPDEQAPVYVSPGPIESHCNRGGF